MRKIAILIVLLVVFSSFVSGFSFDTMLSGNLFSFVTGGSIKNTGPNTNPNAPSDGTVVNGKIVKFDWSYSDVDGDEQQQYNLQIDDDLRFYTPFNYYGLKETVRNQIIPTGDGKYYWRARSYDGLNWGKWSETKSFYLDESEKVCFDNTAFWQCADNKPLYCDGGRLADDCKKCGCPANQICSSSGVCITQTCSDGTLFGSCSVEKPKYCRNGNLVDGCGFCGCPEETYCAGSGSCTKAIVRVGGADFETKQSLLGRIAEFFKNILGFN